MHNYSVTSRLFEQIIESFYPQWFGYFNKTQLCTVHTVFMLTYAHEKFAFQTKLRACLHEGGGPQVGEVTCGRLPHLTK